MHLIKSTKEENKTKDQQYATLGMRQILAEFAFQWHAFVVSECLIPSQVI